MSYLFTLTVSLLVSVWLIYKAIQSMSEEGSTNSLVDLIGVLLALLALCILPYINLVSVSILLTIVISTKRVKALFKLSEVFFDLIYAIFTKM